jgi:hypothetical protein
MDMKLKIEILKPRDFIAKDLRTSKYRMRVAVSKKSYNRQSDKQSIKKELAYG